MADKTTDEKKTGVVHVDSTGLLGSRCAKCRHKKWNIESPRETWRMCVKTERDIGSHMMAGTTPDFCPLRKEPNDLD